MKRRLPAVFLIAITLLAAPALAATPIPPGGDCEALQRQYPARALWYGTFSGRQHDDWYDDRPWSVFANRMVYVRGCFLSEYACKRWLHEVVSAVVNPGLMRCRLVDQVPR